METALRVFCSLYGPEDGPRRRGLKLSTCEYIGGNRENLAEKMPRIPLWKESLYRQRSYLRLQPASYSWFDEE